MKLRWLVAAASIVALTAFAASGRAQDSSLPCNALPPTNPLDFGALRLSPCEAWTPPPGDWWSSATSSYFNAWNDSWHAHTIHEELHRQHQPLTSDELRLLESRGPTDNIYQVDVEGWREDVALARGFPWGSVLIRLSAFEIGAPHWDAVAEVTHRMFHAKVERSEFPNSQTLLYLRSPQHRTELRRDIAGFHPGNPSISFSYLVHQSESFEHHAVVSAQIPIARGNQKNLASSGGWDGEIDWLTNGRLGRTDIGAAAGYTIVERGVTFYGFPRANVWHLMARAGHPLFRGIEGWFGWRADGSVIGGAMEAEPAQPDLNVFLGISTPIGRGGSLMMNVGENMPSVGLGADWSFHIQYTRVLSHR